jgi:hypothetical protein
MAGQFSLGQRFLLELDGKLAGRLVDFESIPSGLRVGGFSPMPQNRPAQPMALTCGTGMSQSFYDWISSTFRRQYRRRDGAVITLDGASKPISRLNFRAGLISSVDLPPLDVSSKQPAYMTVTLIVERISFENFTDPRNVGPYGSAIPKAWAGSNFRIKIDGLEQDCVHVTKIEALSLGQKMKMKQTSSGRDNANQPTGLNFSRVVLELPKLFSGGFEQWSKDSVMEGKNISQNERNGTLDFLAPSTTTPYFGLKLQGLGIQSLAWGTTAVTVEMYCHDMDFSASGAVK